MQQRQIIKSTDLPITQKRDYPNGKNQAVQFSNDRPENMMQLKVQQIANSTVQRQENKTGMPDDLKSGIESLSRIDMSDVKVHYNSSQPAQLQAHAFAQGNQIHLGPGQEKHLPHEAWHVVQQKQGRVQPTKQLKSKVNINDDAALEREADVMGAKALIADTSKGDYVQLKSVNQIEKKQIIQYKTYIAYDAPQNFTFGNVTEKVGSKMTANLDPAEPIYGSETMTGDIHDPLMKELPKEQGWKKGHLLNHELGGRAMIWNLFPITAHANAEHSTEVEEIIKKWIGGGAEVWYEVKANAEDASAKANANGEFVCIAYVKNTSNPLLTGKKINKTIKSKMAKGYMDRVYDLKDTETVKKFAGLIRGLSNNSNRDGLKGLTKDPNWLKRGGREELNSPKLDQAMGLSHVYNKTGLENGELTSKHPQFATLMSNDNQLTIPHVVKKTGWNIEMVQQLIKTLKLPIIFVLAAIIVLFKNNLETSKNGGNN